MSDSIFDVKHNERMAISLESTVCRNHSLITFSVTVVRISMKHEEEKRVTGNKIQHAKKDLTYHGTYGWLFQHTMCLKMFRERKFEIFI